MPEREPIASPHTVAVRKAIAATIADASGVAQLWSALEIQITGSGLALGLEATAEISGFAVFGVVGGSLALAAAPVILLGLGAAILTSDENTSHAIADGIDVVTDYTSPSTLSLIALTAPFNSLLPTAGFKDPFAAQKLGGQFGDLATGLLSSNPIDRLLSSVAFGAGAPGAYKNFQELREYLSQTSSAGQQQDQGNSIGAPSRSTLSGSAANMPSDGSFLSVSPGIGDFGNGFYENDDNSYSAVQGDFTMFYTPRSTDMGGAVDAGSGYESSGNTGVYGSGTYGSGGTTNSDCAQSGNTDCTQDCNTDCAQDCSTDCTHDCSTDCVHDCSHECSDCSHDCSDCE